MAGTYSCGCQAEALSEGVYVRFGGEECDAVDGFRPAVTHAYYCAPCAAKVETWGECIRSEDEEDEWLAEGPNYQRWRAAS